MEDNSPSLTLSATIQTALAPIVLTNLVVSTLLMLYPVAELTKPLVAQLIV